MKTLMERFYAKEELTLKEREEIRAGSIRVNSARCKLCNDIIVSDNRHDLKHCKCGKLFVDGGSWYLRRGFQSQDDYEELSQYYEDIDAVSSN